MCWDVRGALTPVASRAKAQTRPGAQGGACERVALGAGCAWSCMAQESFAKPCCHLFQLPPVTARRKAENTEIFLLEGLVFIAKGVLWVTKNKAVLTGWSLPSLPCSFLSSSHYSWDLFLWVLILENAWRSDCAQREYSAPISPIPTSLQHTPTQRPQSRAP